MNAYTENQESATSNVMESSPVAQALVEFLDRMKNEDGQDKWTGTVKMLLVELQKYETYKSAKKAPKAANVLSGHLRRISPSLRIQGIEIVEGRKTEKGKEITIKRIHPDDNPDDKHQTDDTDRQNDGYRQDDRQENDQPVAPADTTNREFPDDPDDKKADDSSFYPPLDFEKREEKEEKKGRPDNYGKTSSGSSGSSAIPPKAANRNARMTHWDYRKTEEGAQELGKEEVNRDPRDSQPQNTANADDILLEQDNQETKDTSQLDYEAACQLLNELQEAGATIEWLPDGKRMLHAPPNTKWQQPDWANRIDQFDTELRDILEVRQCVDG